MFGKLNYSDAKVIVELGGGRGVFTHEILKLMSSECKLLVFEVNEVFCNQLKSEIQDERVTIINDSAEHIGAYLQQHQFEKQIISFLSLPNFMFSPELKESIYKTPLFF